MKRKINNFHKPIRLPMEMGNSSMYWQDSAKEFLARQNQSGSKQADEEPQERDRQKGIQ